MAEILQYKCVKADNKPFLFLDHSVSEEWVPAQLACRELINATRALCDTLEISESEFVISKTCADANSLSRFILEVSMLEADHKFALEQFELYHTTSFSHSHQTV
jgi:hypothetical protein